MGNFIDGLFELKKAGVVLGQLQLLNDCISFAREWGIPESVFNTQRTTDATRRQYVQDNLPILLSAKAEVHAFRERFPQFRAELVAKYPDTTKLKANEEEWKKDADQQRQEKKTWSERLLVWSEQRLENQKRGPLLARMLAAQTVDKFLQGITDNLEELRKQFVWADTMVEGSQVAKAGGMPSQESDRQQLKKAAIEKLQLVEEIRATREKNILDRAEDLVLKKQEIRERYKDDPQLAGEIIQEFERMLTEAGLR